MPRIDSIRHAPGFRALLIQSAAFLIVLAIAAVLQLLFARQLSIGAAALSQGTIALLLTRWQRLAVWWLPIQFLFPLVVIAALSAELPPLLFLGGFILMLALYWTTFHTQVPFYPSTPAVWNAVLELLPKESRVRVVDIGSGFGGLILFLAERRPDCEFIGIELAPLPWLSSVLRARFRGSAASFVRGNYEKIDFAAFDVVFAYLSPAAMPALWEKAKSEMRAGTTLLSYEFAISGQKSHIIIRPVADGPTLYGWRM